MTTMNRHACRVCKCTEDRACDGGCSWAEPDLCSQCTLPAIASELDFTLARIVAQQGNAIPLELLERANDDSNRYARWRKAMGTKKQRDDAVLRDAMAGRKARPRKAAGTPPSTKAAPRKQAPHTKRKEMQKRKR